jgi:hypothetical protein
MSSKPCSLCGQPADISVLLLASTLRISPRQQESSPSVRFCSACLGLRHEQMSFGVHARLADALTRTCEALTRHSNEHAHSPNRASGSAMPQPICPEPTNGDGRAASCRPCLIACNSRQSDEVQKE